MTHSGAAPDAGCPWTCVIISVLDAERSCRSHGLAQRYDVAARPRRGVRRAGRAAGWRRAPSSPGHGRRDSQGLPCLRGVRHPGEGLRPCDLPYGEGGLEFRWHKRRWWCREAGCPRRSFTEQIPQIPAGARLTARLRGAAGRRIRDAGPTVIQAARDLHLSWPTVMEAFRTQARDVAEAPLPQVTVLGIDETRRGRPRWERDADTGKWRLTRDRWHTGFVDAAGHGGLLGQVEGRTVADVLAWLATTDLDWRKGIGHVAIDMSATYRAAIRIGLPHATVVVDHFHVVQLANKMLSMVRRRTTAETRGRRGRASDPEWKARRRLLRNRKDLTDDQFATMSNTLLSEGKIGQTLLTAWIAKENLRTLLALARTGADRHQVDHARWKFLTWCADSDIPEARQLASSPPPSTAGGPRSPRSSTPDTATPRAKGSTA
ncbi:ISL3 family transposase [Streptomyces mirabilis]|uniref:ISL3 family transposase n=1 Tax=Streptomyces mirabilis TaxID=68239 RepID=UPI00331B2AD5